MKTRPTGGLVYSTDAGRMCPACRQPTAACVCGQMAVPAGDGIVRVSRETKGRAGKGVTLVKGLALDAAALAALGVGYGDRVVIYMPMVPEAVIAMLACTRLGAIHSVVFGGFAAAPRPTFGGV